MAAPDAGFSAGEGTGRSGQEHGHAIAVSAMYAVTIENLTSNQPLTPPVVATHRAHSL
jgi:hypothetical protein